LDSKIDRSAGRRMVGASDVFRAFETRIRELAGPDVTVLLEGESGSGKNLAARVLHELGSRRTGPFVEVSLAALAPTLIESELFGHEPGAFTSAQSARTGRFLRANGGTIVLDGVESLPGSLQVKLLRVLQERRIEPLGSSAEIDIDVRVIATTSSELAAEVGAGRFREDLYYRLAVVTVRAPPLRARLADLPLLCEALLEQASQRLSVPKRTVGPRALERLAAHSWPGNLRELENALERVLVLPRTGAEAERKQQTVVDPEEFSFLDEAAVGMPEALARMALAHGVSLQDLERALLSESLREQRGNLTAAARQIGLSRRAFEYRSSRAASAPSDANGQPSAANGPGDEAS
jgi:DNA-binding NtrC family response regulator